MLKAKSYLPSKCSNFTPWAKLLNSSDKKEIVKYIIWRDKEIQTGTILRDGYLTEKFADTVICSNFDEITRQEFLYVNWDPHINGWHSNADCSIDELKEDINFLQNSLSTFAKENIRSTA